ncbi:MAG: hypothetical protein AAFQ22_00350 [Pseudomonadota bacterium]
MLRHIRPLMVGFAAILASFGQLNAPAFAEDAPETIAAAPDQSDTIMHVVVEVEGDTVDVRKTLRADGTELYDARPIIEALKGEILIKDTVFALKRFQDGAIMRIDMSDGRVFANESLLGKLPGWEPREEADTWLDVNAISVMTGTHASQDDAGQLVLKLDDRLKPQFDLDLFVDGTRIAFPSAEPRTIGSVLLIPLKDVAEAFGHTLGEDPVNGTVTVTRVQDTAEFTLELATGLVSVNGEPRGVTPNVSYIDPIELLLPSSAVETLTGSHIELRPGSDRIDVTLDERLAGGAMPGAFVDKEATETPLTFERLTFQVTDRGAVGASLSAHARQFNTVTHYEAAGSLAEPETLVPSWLQMEVQSLSGWYATLGDATPRRRELNGVDASRIRGATFSRITGSGRLLSVVAGSPLSGTRQIFDTASVPEFSGFVAGARLIDPESSRELGLAISSTAGGNNTKLVASVQQDFIPEAKDHDEPGLGAVFVSADLGAFSAEGLDPIGLRGQVDGLYTLSRQSSLRGSISHESGNFRASNTNSNADFDGVFDNRVASRTSGQVSVDWRAVESWDMLRGFGAGARIASSVEGDRVSSSLAGSASAQLGTTGIRLAVDAGVSRSSGVSGASGTSNSVTVRAQRSFKWGDAQATLSSDSQETGRNTRLVANVSFEPIIRSFENGAAVAFSPSISAVASNKSNFARMGASAIATSGDAFGENFQIRGQFSALQSVSDDNAQTSFFGSVSAQYDMWDAVRLVGGLNTNFNDQVRFSLGLRGAVEFNEPRKHRSPSEGTGILKGRAFLDRNRDGIRQADEPGVPGVQIALRNTRLALRVDGQGNYTIQNMPEGLYTLDINVRSLPLGMLVHDDVLLRATVADGRITELDVPVISSGQVRGAVFVDTDGDGALTPGEERLEGARLTLTALEDDTFEPIQQIAASFGQYAFEGLAPGRYQILARFGDRTHTVEVDLTEDELFMTQPVGLPPIEAAPDPSMLDGGVEFIAHLGASANA